MIRKINFLEEFVKNAYNVKTRETRSQPVFKISYNNIDDPEKTTKAIDWGKIKGNDMNLPDQISGQPRVVSKEFKENTFDKEEKAQAKSIDAQMEGEFETPMYSGKINSSVSSSGSSASRIESYFSRSYSVFSVLAFERIELGKESLDPKFITEINGLPKDISNDISKKKYIKFFDDYGTHYITTGVVGGVLIMETIIKKSLISSSNSLDIKNTVEGAYDGIINKGSFKASMKIDTSNSQSLANTSLKAEIFTIGGEFNSDKDQTKKEWQDSVYNGPILLYGIPNNKELPLSRFKSISTLVDYASGDVAIKGNMELMLEKYIGETDESSILSYSHDDIKFGQVYNNIEEGFIISSIKKKNDNDKGLIQVMNDDNNSPTELRASASMYYWPGAICNVESASFIMPKPSGTKFIKHKDISGKTEISQKYVSFSGLKGKGLQDWPKKEVEIGTQIIASEDGFLMANIDWNDEDGARGDIICFIYETDKWVKVAGSSQHYYKNGGVLVPSNSFCVPIKKGSTYFFQFNKTSRDPVAKAFFIPLSQDVLKFGEFQPGDKDNIYTAEEDGFLLAHLDATVGQRGYVDLYCSNNELEKLEENLIASTSVHYWEEGDVYVGYNTAMIPVPKGYTYKAELKKNADNFPGLPEIKVTWIPLIRV